MVLPFLEFFTIRRIGTRRATRRIPGKAESFSVSILAMISNAEANTTNQTIE